MSAPQPASTHQPTFGPALDDVIARFDRRHRPGLLAPQDARERCEEVSAAFVACCRAAGIEADLITGAEFGEVPQFPGMRLLLNGHFAAEVKVGEQSIIFDWTARQFDAEAPVPWIVPLDQWRTRWQEMG